MQSSIKKIPIHNFNQWLRTVVTGRLRLACVALAAICCTAVTHSVVAEGDSAQATTTQTGAAKFYTTEENYQFIAPYSTVLAIEQAGDQWFAVGAHGSILRSADGQAWQQVASPSNVLLTNIMFVDEQRGWVVGHEQTILATTDGGQTWQLQHTSQEPNAPLYDIVALSEQQLIAVGASGLLLRSSNAGKTWTAMSQTDSEDEFFTPTTLPADMGYHIDSIIKFENGDLLTTGEYGLLMVSEDKGQNWRLLQSPYIASLFGAVPYQQGVLVYGLRGNVFVADDLASVPEQDPDDFDYSDLEQLDAAGLQAIGWRRLVMPSTHSIFGAKVLADGSVLLVGDKGRVYRLDGASEKITQLTIGYPSYPAAIRDIQIMQNGQYLLAGKAGVRLQVAPTPSESAP